MVSLLMMKWHFNTLEKGGESKQIKGVLQGFFHFNTLEKGGESKR